MPYPIPNWIQPPPDISQPYLRGVGIAAELYNERTRLQQEGQLASMRAALQQQQFERDQQLEQQRMAMTQAYQQQNLAIQQQDLAQKEQMNQLAIQDAARRVQAQQQYQQWIAEHPGQEAEGIMRFFPGTGDSMAGFGQLARQQSLQNFANQPPTPFSMGGQEFMRIPESSGGYRYQNIKPPNDPRLAIWARNTENEIRRLEKEEENDPFASRYQINADGTITETTPSDTPEAKARKDAFSNRRQKIIQLQNSLDDFYAGGQPTFGQLPTPTTAPAPSPKVRPITIDGRPVNQVQSGPSAPSFSPTATALGTMIPQIMNPGSALPRNWEWKSPTQVAGTLTGLAGQVAPWLSNPLIQQAGRAAVPVLPQALQGAYNVYSGGRQLMDPRLGAPPYTNPPSQQLPDELQEPQ